MIGDTREVLACIEVEREGVVEILEEPDVRRTDHPAVSPSLQIRRELWK